ncbi:MAG: type II CRISPR RNA-guided endonuclease Cas9 [Phycisphaeraceae bacterium]|nr:type II CRISPR RNA-guided endonuclease Cas9 [Phycisphaeraceae bacterium]
MSTTLGLDLGPNSIGWALIDNTQHRIVNLGVRVFPEGVDNFDTSKEKSRNEDRRTARGMRRQIARRARRKKRLRSALIEAGLWPDDPTEQAVLEAYDPYELRARAIDEKSPKLTPHELGRVILHLNQRRGFLSNRRADKAKAKEISDMKAEMGELEKRLGKDTLGQYLYEKSKIDATERTRMSDDRVRRWHTKREMLETELLRIAAWHQHILTDDLMFGHAGRQPLAGMKPRLIAKEMSQLQAFGIHGIIFFQRNIYWPKSMIGLCELEPKQPRCPRADRAAQRFRLLQEVNNLRYVDPDTHVESPLTSEQRALLLEKLGRKEKLEFNGKSGIKGVLGFMDTVKFNLERGERPSIKGHVTDVLMAKTLGKSWHERPDPEKDAIVRLLVDPDRSEDAAKEQLQSQFGLTAEDAEAALSADLPAGYVHVSLKAIERLLPHMERGLVYQMTNPENSAIHAAGYLRADQLRRRIFDKLPDPERTPDAPIGDIPNPVVRRALVELRKLVNAIIREHGKPDSIHIEMIRDVKQGEKARRAYNLSMRDREKNRDAAAEKLRENGVKVTREAINRYLLWEEQGHICIYSGDPISFKQLYSGEIDTDHILPYSRCLDDSLMNKVVCFRRSNDQKGQRSPYEWVGATGEKSYDGICQRARKLPYPKYRRFLLKELKLDDFIARQLVDTSYIARATAEYLQCIVARPQDVLGIKGQLTADMRIHWGLNDLLDAGGGMTKSRDDHRHHAIDALVVALTDRSRLQSLTRIRKSGGVLQTGETLDPPWNGFRDEAVARIKAVHVSHRAERKVAGALHEDTLYGVHKNDAGKVVAGEFVVRKPLESLSPNEVEMIRDPMVKEAIKKRLAEHGVDVGRDKNVSPDVWKRALCSPDNPVRLVGKKSRGLGPPILKVRVIRKEQTIQKVRNHAGTAYVKPGSTHHLSIFEFKEKGKTKREGVWTTMLEAAERLKKQNQLLQNARQRMEKELGYRLKPVDPRLGKEMQKIALEVPIITRKHPYRPEAKFCFSLRRGEAVLAKVDGEEKLLIYNTSASTQGQIYLYHHADARPKSSNREGHKRKIVSFTANTLNARKVTVDYLGRIRWAND